MDKVLFSLVYGIFYMCSLLRILNWKYKHEIGLIFSKTWLQLCFVENINITNRIQNFQYLSIIEMYLSSFKLIINSSLICS